MTHVRRVGVVVALLALGCDAGNSRAETPYAPAGGKADEPATSAIEAFDFDALARDLVSQAAEPLDDDAPGSEPEDDTGGDSDSGGDADDSDTGSGEDPDVPDTGGDEPGDTGGDAGEPCGFECADGTCIDATWECDGFDDCSAAEDEANCGDSCSGHTCGDGTCIDGSWVCDDFVDCADGSDESACGVAQQGFDLTGQRGPQELSATCVFTSTATGAAAGAATAEIISTSCVAGGVVVGVATAPSGGGAVGGFGVAAVCGVADISQIDAVAGGVAGAVTGLVGGVTFCEGGIVDQANNFINWLWGSEPEAIPVYNMQSSGSGSSAVPGLGAAALTCTPAPSNRETGYNDEGACGKNNSFDMVCNGSQSCDTMKQLADRNLICHWARIVSANTFRDGAPNDGHLAPIRATRENFGRCKELIEDNCDFDDDPMSEDEAQDEAMGYICG